MKEEVKKESFLKKYKNDSRYKAKVELLGGCLFILFLILWINISAIMSDSNYNYVESNTVTNTIKEDDSSIINKLRNNNYAFKIEISKTKDNNIDTVIYDGKIYNNTKLVNKKHNELIEEYYINNNNYYLKNNNEYTLTNSSKYYDFIASTFMDLNSIVNYINIGKLVNTENTNDGKIIKTYNILLKDISLINSEEYITITIIEDNINTGIEFNVDYTNLYNTYDINKLDSLTLKYNINDIGKIEEIKDIKIK